jgi:hypothetical protein
MLKVRNERARADGGLVPHILRFCATQRDVWAWRANSGVLPLANADGSTRYVQGGEPGTPDVLGVLLTRAGRSIFFGVEAKRQGIGKKRRDSQIAWHAKALTFGVPVITVDSISEVDRFFRRLRA